MEGLHLTADLAGCRRDAALLVTPPGEPAWLLLAESHLAVHTWPELGGITLDVYVCNFSADNSEKARRLMSGLEEAFQPGRSRRQHLHRGRPCADTERDEVVLEDLNDHSVYGFRFQRRLLSMRTRHQQLELLESAQLGRTLRLDGRFMTSEKDEFFYHEALVHPAALAHPLPERALILGGGDGGTAEELLKHGSVERVTLVDLDAEVIEVARRELLSIHRGALDDPRVRVLCEDGDLFVSTTEDSFDLVFLDLTDPETPAGPLYTQAFMSRLKRLLAPGGAVVLLLGAPFFEGELVRSLIRSLRHTFRMVSPYGLYIPLYGSYWGMAVASDDLDPLSLSPLELANRLQRRAITDLHYYNPLVHAGLFALPNFYRELT